MATTVTKISNQGEIVFFPEQRRKVVLDNFAPKCNQENEKRIRLDFILPLTGEKLVGIPAFLNDSYIAFDKEESAAEEITLTTEIEGVTVEFYATPTTKRDRLLTSVTLRKFQLVRLKDGIIALRFNINAPGSKDLLGWAWDYCAGTLWASFTMTQATFKAPDAQMKLGEEEGMPSQTDERKKSVEAPDNKKSARDKADRVLSGKKPN